MSGPLIRYDAARRALAEAHRVDEVKDIRDMAVAMQAYAEQAKDSTMIMQATQIRMRAEHRAGEMLAEMAASGNRHSGRAHTDHVGSRAATPRPEPTLADLGINKTQSSRWQQLAALPGDQFEAKIESASRRAYHRIGQRMIKADRIVRAKRQHASLIDLGCSVDDLVALAATGKRFPVILADPPWVFETYGGASGKLHSSPDHHYPTCSVDEIARLPVASLAADDAVLLLWSTWPHIAIASHVDVIRAWGFKPSTAAFLWVKQNAKSAGLHSGMGYWTLSNSEVCLLATRGSPLRLANDVHQVVMAPVGEHSAKPEEVRRRIERLFAGPYLELYAREAAPGWTAWGNEIPRNAGLG